MPFFASLAMSAGELREAWHGLTVPKMRPQAEKIRRCDEHLFKTLGRHAENLKRDSQIIGIRAFGKSLVKPIHEKNSFQKKRASLNEGIPIVFTTLLSRKMFRFRGSSPSPWSDMRNAVATIRGRH